MLTEKERAFLAYWEKNRDRQKKWIYQLAVGLPFGLLIGVIIITNFSAGWYKRAEMIANSKFNPAVLYVAVAIIAIFFAIFSKKFQWDQREQSYKEIKAKENTNENQQQENEHSSTNANQDKY